MSATARVQSPQHAAPLRAIPLSPMIQRAFQSEDVMEIELDSVSKKIVYPKAIVDRPPFYTVPLNGPLPPNQIAKAMAYQQSAENRRLRHVVYLDDLIFPVIRLVVVKK